MSLRTKISAYLKDHPHSPMLDIEAAVAPATRRAVAGEVMRMIRDGMVDCDRHPHDTNALRRVTLALCETCRRAHETVRRRFGGTRECDCCWLSQFDDPGGMRPSRSAAHVFACQAAIARDVLGFLDARMGVTKELAADEVIALGPMERGVE